ncbi:MFS transporter [Curtobacterium sp. MCLR17_032]|uniref:MFS transporter n=1 Tax=Curtobacterium sp. MCLR17_032 TaxID=2175650 RepID=UPI0011B68D5F|nr:MFS transporter [Curtobacterium sp. MCLR17_032]WIE62103.1 MFS transporter [Curtobacterium sp. MCLR17_032]
MATAHAPSSFLLGAIRSARSRYGGVLRRPGALGFFLPAALARLGVAMTGLGLLFSVQHASGSFAVAGAATGSFAVAEAAVGPQVARLVDRWGQSVTVPAVTVVHVVAVIAAVLLAGSAPVAVTLAAVVLAGAAMPQPGALSAARWAGLLAEPTALRVAFSLEATVNDAVFLVGPVLATLASSLLAPWAGSAAAAMLVAVGCGVVSLQRHTAPRPHRPRASHTREPSHVLAVPGFRWTLGVNLGLGCFFGAVPLLVTAVAAARGMQPLIGVVLALSSAASIVAGLAYGALRTSPRPQVVQLVASIVLAVAVLIGAAWPTLAGLMVMLLVGGTAIAPLVASSSQIVQATVPAAALTQGFTWINSASAAGIALGAALTGALVAHSGVGAAAIGVSGLVLIAVASAVVAARR